MSKRKNNAPSAQLNELDDLLAGIEHTVPEGLLAQLNSNEEVAAELVAHDALLESLELEETQLLESLADEEVIVIQGEDALPAIDKAAMYAAQDSVLTVGSEDDAAPINEPVVIKAKKGRKAATTVTPTEEEPATPRLTVNAGPRSAQLSAKTDLTELSKLGMDEDAIRLVVEAIDSLPTKVAEKAYNLVRYAAGREAISNYTRFAIETLRDKGAMSIPELVKAMEARGWSTGTSRSQSQQMSRLFTAYDMTTRVDGKISLRLDNPFVNNIIERIAK
jgi:hypothetical protein